MRDIPDHPVIASIERTGYPPWIKDEPEDESADYDLWECDHEYVYDYEHDWECDGDDSDD